MKTRVSARLLSCALASCLTHLSACASQPPSPLQWGEQSADGSPQQGSSLTTLYHKTVQQWTRHGEVFERFEGKLFVSATCLSPALESSRALWHSERKALTSDEKNATKSRLVQRSKGQLLFFVAVATQDQSSNDLRPRGSSLKAHLIIKGEAHEPKWINELSVQERLSASVDFPYLSPLFRAYWVSFPAQPTLEPLSLRVSSLKGTVTLDWDVRDDAQALKERR